ncbi:MULTISPECIES: hypothetical protein [Pseudomonas]|nr:MULTISPECIES: hypothetical protein [Pseudomonas]MCX9136204.1 hypothetical protein [Pseudomonas sp. DCB_PUT]MDD1972331.1 hypothetical protein [Pseudomonas putida]UUI36905.1 hypothetical protein NP430_08730 [Pseudomonas putida]
MNAYEPGVWFDKKELDVPAIPFEQMHLYGSDSVVRAACVVNAPA